MKTKLLSLLLLFSFSMGAVYAQQGVRARAQKHRIREGVKSGELTPAEAAHLRHDQRAIRSEVRDAKADGVVTPSERQEIRQDKRVESRKIYRKKHNDRTRN